MLRSLLAAHVSQRPQHLILHVTTRCPYRCPTCFVDTASPVDLPVELAERALLEAGPVFWCDLGGGEPTLHDGLPRIAAAVQARILGIPTNAWDPERVAAVARDVRAAFAGDLIFILSLDGLQATNDRLRAPGSYARVWATFDRLRAIPGLFVKLSTVLCRENADELVECMEDVWRHRPDFHSIVLLRGRPRDPAYGLPPVERLRALLPRVLEIQRRYAYGQTWLRRRALRRFHHLLWRYSLETLETGRQATPCYAGGAHLVIWANGDVAPCELLPPIGSLYRSSLREMLAGPAARRARSAIRAGRCACTHNCALLASIMFNPRHYGRLLTGTGAAP